MASLLATLNPEQRAAVILPPEHALILAGAGSGKTRVLTTRMAWLLQTGQLSPGGLLAVTFTNKAAKEMLTRLTTMLPINARGMWVGTFHGLCNRLLRAHYKLVGLPATFQILDTQDQLSAVKRLLKAHNVDDEQFPPKQLQWFINGCKEEGLRPQAVPTTRDETARRRIELYTLYEAQCQREGVVDFAELLLRSYELLRDHTAVRQHYQRRFRQVLVDEFQDTNRLQYLWLKALAGVGSGLGGTHEPGAAVLAVGDDDQSIYAFRGARVGNMADFVREFGVRHQIKLEENYRSASHILDTANHLIAHNQQRLGKNLRTSQAPGEPVRVSEAASDFEEAQALVEEMRQLHAAGMAWHEMGVLYRSNAQSRVIETALFNASVAYRVYGGLRFFERAEIKHALAYLRLLENPADDTSFLRVVNFPPRGIGARTLELLQDAARDLGCPLRDAVAALKGKAQGNVTAFVALIDVLREDTQGLTLREIIERMLKVSGLLAHYAQDREGAERIENLEELVNAAESFVTQEGFGRDAVALPLDETAAGAALTQSPASQGLDLNAPLLDQALPAVGAAAITADGETLSPLAAFLTHAALEAGDNQAQAGQDAVQLMTVHAAKGLEFDAVFITGLEEGLFPNERALTENGGLEEERRLMYVAVTRARRRLYLSHSQTRMLHGQTRYNLRSRFLDELPDESVKWITPKARAAAAPAWGAPGWGGGAGAAGRGASNFVAGSAGNTAQRGRFDSDNWAHRGASAPARDEDRGGGPTLTPASTAAATGLSKGQKVFHTKFGEGKVLTIEGAGPDARAQVEFGRHGTKWLALSVAKLTPID